MQVINKKAFPEEVPVQTGGRTNEAVRNIRNNSVWPSKCMKSLL